MNSLLIKRTTVMEINPKNTKWKDLTFKIGSIFTEAKKMKTAYKI